MKHEYPPQPAVRTRSWSTWCKRGGVGYSAKHQERSTLATKDRGSPTGELLVSLDLPPEPTSIGQARKAVESRMSPAMPCHAELRLITSELVTNAVQHAKTRFQVQLIRDGYTFRLSVTDQSAARPTLGQQPDPLMQRGRGLMIVQAFATNWAFRSSTAEKPSGSH